MALLPDRYSVYDSKFSCSFSSRQHLVGSHNKAMTGSTPDYQSNARFPYCVHMNVCVLGVDDKGAETVYTAKEPQLHQSLYSCKHHIQHRTEIRLILMTESQVCVNAACNLCSQSEKGVSVSIPSHSTFFFGIGSYLPHHVGGSLPAPRADVLVEGDVEVCGRLVVLDHVKQGRRPLSRTQRRRLTR